LPGDSFPAESPGQEKSGGVTVKVESLADERETEERTKAAKTIPRLPVSYRLSLALALDTSGHRPDQKSE
jgi:hypothetical protein